jgi:hypothetical protein
MPRWTVTRRPSQPAAERVDGAGDLAAGDGGQLGRRPGAADGALAQCGVDEVDPGGGDPDADLAGAGVGVVDLLVDQVLGRAEGVQADGVHGGLLALSRVAPACNLKRT